MAGAIQLRLADFIHAGIGGKSTRNAKDSSRPFFLRPAGDGGLFCPSNLEVRWETENALDAEINANDSQFH